MVQNSSSGKRRAASHDHEKKRLIVVLGMHRSGTSAVTRALQVLGVTLGDNLLPPVANNNDTGFWEDVDLYELNVEMLGALGIDWHNIASIEFSDVEALRKKGYFLKAAELLQQKVSNASFAFGFKDPRTAKLLPFWKEIFSHCQLDTSYVLTVHHPLSVAKSLAKREGFDAEKSYLLWLGHVITSLVESAGERRMVVDYDRLIQSPDRELNRIAECLDLEIDQAELGSYKSEFLDETLRHTVYTLNDLSLEPICPPLVNEMYTSLLQVARDQSSPDDSALQREIFRWANEFRRLGSTLALVDKLFINIASLSQANAKHGAQIINLTQATAEGEAQIASLTQTLARRDRQIATLAKRNENTEYEIVRVKQDLSASRAEEVRLRGIIQEIVRSTSWRVTRPIRFAKRLATQPDYVMKWAADSLRKFLRKILLSLQMKNAIKSRLERTRLAVVLRDRSSLAFAPEVSAVVDRSGTANAGHETYIQQILSLPYPVNGIATDYVPEINEAIDFTRAPLQIIAFYLPQFHPIPENDKWWGKGFTDWTNVSKAVPQYVGHYQPHLPGELGFYDLRLVDVMRQQTDLARRYGIGGFCFHHYWFGGRRLLERPVKQYLEANDIDFPFCLCWANENWTRRWDGQENDVLMAQSHTPEQDDNFIDDILPALRDPRYIRFNGKPVLIVYRVSLLPDAAATAKRWRQHSIEAGVGDLYLIAARTFEITDPRPYGFDASIEFPPHQIPACRINDRLTIVNPNYRGNIYDYEGLVSWYVKQRVSDYPLIKTVSPSWDNEARRPGAGHTFHGANPSIYAHWLRKVYCATVENVKIDEKQPPFVFVNAWNEWAEGAHLEPDRKYGYGYLHATANVVREFMEPDVEVISIVRQSQKNFLKQSDAAVIVHLHYEDLFNELRERIEVVDNADILISIRADISVTACREILSAFPKVRLAIFSNRGRDIQPFLQMLRFIRERGYKLACKIHSKKSPQRHDGAQLRRNALNDLLRSLESVTVIKKRFADDPSLGIVAPRGSLLPLDEPDCNVRNRAWLDKLLTRAHMDNVVGANNCNFIAGSMFWFRVEALTILDELDLSVNEFEDELGQVDGTLAHAVERLFAVTAEERGFRVEEI